MSEIIGAERAQALSARLNLMQSEIDGIRGALALVWDAIADLELELFKDKV